MDNNTQELKVVDGHSNGNGDGNRKQEHTDQFDQRHSNQQIVNEALVDQQAQLSRKQEENYNPCQQNQPQSQKDHQVNQSPSQEQPQQDNHHQRQQQAAKSQTSRVLIDGVEATQKQSVPNENSHNQQELQSHNTPPSRQQEIQGNEFVELSKTNQPNCGLKAQEKDQIIQVNPNNQIIQSNPSNQTNKANPSNQMNVANNSSQPPMKQSDSTGYMASSLRPESIITAPIEFKHGMNNAFPNQSSATWRQTTYRYSFSKSARFNSPSSFSQCPDLLAINMPSTLSKVTCSLNRGGSVPLTDQTPTQNPFTINNCRIKWEKRDSTYTPAPNAYHIDSTIGKSNGQSSTHLSPNKQLMHSQVIPQQSKHHILASTGFEALKTQKQAPSSPKKGKCTFGLPWSKYSHTYVPHRQDIATREALQAKIKDKQMHETEIKSYSVLGGVLNGTDINLTDKNMSYNLSSEQLSNDRKFKAQNHLRKSTSQQNSESNQAPRSVSCNLRNRSNLNQRQNKSCMRPSSQAMTSNQVPLQQQSPINPSQTHKNNQIKPSFSNIELHRAKQSEPFSPISHHSHFAPRFSIYGRLEMFSQKVAREKVWIPAPWDTQGKAVSHSHQSNIISQRSSMKKQRVEECSNGGQVVINDMAAGLQVNPQQLSPYRSRSKYFSTSSRIDFTRPANLNPGAKYKIGRWPNAPL